jgi:tellurite resistance protein TerC
LTVPIWAWAIFIVFVIAMLALDVFVLHRNAHEVSLREAGVWSAVWIVLGLGFGAVVWAWAGGGTAQAYLAGYLIEKSLSVDNIFLFAAIFSAFAIPARHQHRVLMFGIIGALVMRAAFIAAGISLLEAVHPVIYVFGAVLLFAAFNMLRGGPSHSAPEDSRALRWLRRWLPVTDELHGQRFLLRGGHGKQRGRLLATPLLVALIVIETADVIFAVDSIPAILAVTTDPFVVYTSNVFALLGMRALYFLLAGAAGRLRYLRPGLAVILGAVAVKLLLADVWEFPAWSAPAFITAVLAVVAVASVRDDRVRANPDHANRDHANRDHANRDRDDRDRTEPNDRCTAEASAPRGQAHAEAREGSCQADGPRPASAAVPRAARR